MPHPKIPGLPKGWLVREFRQSNRHERDGAVLCEREIHDEFNTNYVSWTVNMIEGGCTGGQYYYKYEDALTTHNRRAGMLN